MNKIHILRQSNTDGFIYDALFVEPSGLVFKPIRVWSDAEIFSLDEVTEIEKILTIDSLFLIDRNGFII